MTCFLRVRVKMFDLRDFSSSFFRFYKFIELHTQWRGTSMLRVERLLIEGG